MIDDEDDEPMEQHRRARAPAPARAQAPKEPTEDPLDQRAHAAAGPNAEIDDRVMVIALYLTQGRWNRQRALHLANLWAVSPKTIKGYATDAARLNRQLKGAEGLKAVRRKVEAQLDLAVEMAVASGDAKAVVAAAKLRAEMAGLLAPKKIAATDTKGRDVSPNIPKPPPHIQRILDHKLGKRLWALQDRLPTDEQMAQLDAGVPLLDVARNAGLLPGGLPDCANLCHTGQAMAEKKPTEPSAPSAPVPPPEVAPAVTPPSLGAALAAAAKETKLSGHQLLGQLASLNGIPEEMGRAMHDLAFVVNTGLAGHKAPDGLKKLSPEALAALVQEVIDGALDVPAVTALLRERFPEPPRVQLPY